jgi:ABC-type branched-subunit amino acid transport system substrate-binding protein
MSDAMEAIIDWCNDQGGINGREVVGRYYDAKLTEVNNVMTEACTEVFMLVGQGWALDSGQEATRVGCGLPSVPGFATSAAFAHGPDAVAPVPSPIDFTPTHVAAALAKLFPQEVKQAGTLVANYAATLENRAKAKSAFPAHGWTFLPDCDVEYNIAGEADWKPLALRLKECGAQMVVWSGAPYPNFENFLEAADQIGYHPIYQLEANSYDESFKKWSSNGLADRAYMRLAFVPFEERDQSPATDAYLTLVEEAGGDVSLLGAQATSAFLLWATAADACGPDVTRTCVLDEARQVHDWTAGGLHVPTDPGSNMPPECGILLRVHSGEFLREVPKEPVTSECDPSYAGRVTGQIVDDAHLDADRISTLAAGR